MWSKAVMAFKLHFSSFCKVLVTVTMSQELFVRTEWNQHVAWSPAHIKSSVNGVLGSHDVLWKWSRSVLSDSLWPHGLYSPWNSPGQNTGVGSLSLLQGISPTQELNPGLPHCRQILYQLSKPEGQSKNTGMVAYPFSKGSSLPRNQTGISCIVGGFFTSWAIREEHVISYSTEQKNGQVTVLFKTLFKAFEQT